MTDKEKLASWWTPDGWVRAPEPTAFREILDAERPEGVSRSWDGLLAEHQYVRQTKPDEDCWELQLNVYQHHLDSENKAHLLIEIDASDGMLGTAFVADEHIAAFWFDKYPALVLAERQIVAAEAQIKQTRALLAFVRHGHGKHLIDSDGVRTMDDRDAEREMAEYARKLKAQQPKPNAP